MKNRKAVLMSVFIMVTAVIFAAGPAKEIKVLTYKVLATDAMQALQAQFEHKTGIKVVWEIASEPEVWDKVGLQIATRGSEYDVFPVPFTKVGELAKSGGLQVLDEYVSRKANPNFLDINDFVPGALGAMKVGGKLYGLPFFMWQAILAYRKDIYEKVGITEPPATLEEFAENVKKTTITVDGEKIYGFAGRGAVEPHTTQSLTFAYAMGGQFFDGKFNPTITTPEFIKGVDLYVSLLKNYGPPDSATADWWLIQNSFSEGKVANLLDADTEWSVIFEDPSKSKVAGKVGFAVSPKGARWPGYMYACGWGIAANSKNKDDAWQFVQWSTSPDFQYRSAMDVGRVDVTSQSVINDKEFAKKYAFVVPVMTSAMKTVHAEYFPHIPQYTEVMTAYLREISRAIDGEITTKQALGNASIAIKKIMEKAGYYKQ
jgi:ABC-type glycerol-3-phosphate transport system substrate-binding protein